MQSVKRLPPYSKELRERIICGNLPFHVRVCYGQGSWEAAKYYNQFNNDMPSLVMPSGESPKKYNWPVQGCDVVIHRLAGPSDKSINELTICLLSLGARQVCLINNGMEPQVVIYRQKVTNV